MKWRYLVLGGIGIALCAGLFWFGKPAEVSGIPAGTEDERLLYLFSQGFKGRELSAQEIVVPELSDVVFADYAAMQEMQGLPVGAYCGRSAVRYVYELEQTELCAELLVADKVLIGAMCCDPGKHTMLTAAGEVYP